MEKRAEWPAWGRAAVSPFLGDILEPFRVHTLQIVSPLFLRGGARNLYLSSRLTNSNRDGPRLPWLIFASVFSFGLKLSSAATAANLNPQIRSKKEKGPSGSVGRRVARWL